jgi:hypothetical protein
MHRRTHYLLLLITALWLPLQSLTAFVMPLAWMAGSGTAQAAEMALEDDMPCHGHGAGTEESAPVDQGTCHRCGVCQLASAGYIPATVCVACDLPVSQSVSVAPTQLPASQFPEPPDQPPVDR